MKPDPTRIVRLLFFLLATITLTGCNEPELQSQWQTQPVNLDGSDADWPANAQYFDEDSRMLVSVMNDEYNLYIRLSTRSQATKMMFLRAGFTTWIDDTGGTDKEFGVQFPLAKQGHTRGTMQDHKPRTGMQEILEDSQYNLAILNSSTGNRHTIPTTKAAQMGIYARLGMEEDSLVYELKVPYAVSEGNKFVGIGFETGKIERPSRNGGGGRGSGGGGGGGGGGGKKMGGKGGRQGGGSPDGGRPEPFEVWAKVYLADISSTYQARN